MYVHLFVVFTVTFVNKIPFSFYLCTGINKRIKKQRKRQVDINR